VFYDGTPVPTGASSWTVTKDSDPLLDLMFAHGGGYKSAWIRTGTIHHEAVYEDVWIEEVWHWENHDGYWE
jgi:predicted nuclease of predicted toxin-antitoxin system